MDAPKSVPKSYVIYRLRLKFRQDNRVIHVIADVIPSPDGTCLLTTRNGESVRYKVCENLNEAKRRVWSIFNVSGDFSYDTIYVGRSDFPKQREDLMAVYDWRFEIEIDNFFNGKGVIEDKVMKSRQRALLERQGYYQDLDLAGAF